jgi:hypothetical protein
MITNPVGDRGGGHEGRENTLFAFEVNVAAVGGA